MATASSEVVVTLERSFSSEPEQQRHFEEVSTPIPPPSSHSSLCRRRKEKIYTQGYTFEQRRDAKREAAKAFFLSIPLDSELKQEGNNEEEDSKLQPTAPPPLPLLSIAEISSPQPTTVTSTGLQFTRDPGLVESPRRSRRNKKIQGSTSFNASTSTQHKLSYAGGGIVMPQSMYTLRSFSLEPEDRRLGFVYNGYPVSLYSLIPYCKPLRADAVSAGRARTSSISVQLELDSIDLGDPTKETSLAPLLEPVWRSEPLADQPKQALLARSAKKSTPLLVHQTSFTDVAVTPTTSRSYGAHMFRENHASQFVNLNYDPRSLDNPEYFKGRNVTTLNLPSYRVSLVKYAREREVKKEINYQFAEMFPYIKLTLSKLRSIKKEIISVGIECGVDPVVIAHALVYFEKLVLMGKVSKSTRKLLAGASLLLAVKFSSDTKRQNIKNLIEEMIDKFRVSQKELLLYEFPTLVALDFSLLTPMHQVKPHIDHLSSLE